MRPFDLLQQQAERASTRIALRHKNDALIYRELLDRVNQASQQLSKLGVTKGDRVALYLQKSIDLVVYLLAVNAIGAVFVPINPLLKIPQLNHILRDTQAKLLVTHSQRVDINAADIGLLLQVDTQSIKQKAYAQSSLISPDNLSCLLYTSGSTGLPKGVMLSDRNLIAGAEAVTQYLNNTSDDVLLGVLPLSFDYGLNQLISSLLVGAELVFRLSVTLRDHQSYRHLQGNRRCWRATDLATTHPVRLVHRRQTASAVYHQLWWSSCRARPTDFA